MGDWERTFGEAGMKADFIDSMLSSWGKQNSREKAKITLLFATATEALSWAKEHPGCAVTPHPNNDGYIARTWLWRFDDGDLFGSQDNIRAANQERQRRDGIINHAGQIMQQHTYEGAEWLFYSGHENLLTALYEETRGMRHRSFEEEHIIRNKLVNLLPEAMDSINLYEVRQRYHQSKGSVYQIKGAVSGWLGEVDSPI